MAIKQKILVKIDLNPYLRDNDKYFSDRQKLPKRGLRAKRYKKFNHKCTYCDQPLRNGEPIEIHHIVSKKTGGSNQFDNLVPRHRRCHQSRTYNQKIAKTERKPGDKIPKSYSNKDEKYK